MILKIPEIFQKKERTYSFELFPPKTETGGQSLLKTITDLAQLSPDFISCTYGAGGGNREKTFDIVQHIQEKHHITGLAHLTCVLHTKDEILAILKDIRRRGVQNVLALRGDPPQGCPDWTPGLDNFQYSSELCAFIRKHFHHDFGIGVAGFPEGHLLCRNLDQDAGYLKTKVVNGADFVITQLFFNNQDYFSYVQRLRGLGIQVRIIPGILPITNYQSLLKFCDLCGATVTDEIQSLFQPIQDDLQATMDTGIHFCIRQCRELLAGGAPGLHFYTLNKIHPVDTVLTAVRR
jgi:methylenetetrahydrofolate reductase (NADPH)